MTGDVQALSKIVGMTRTARLVIAPLLVALAMALASGCGGSGGSGGGAAVSGEPISLQELAQSASSSAGATSGRFVFDMTMSFPGADEPFAFSGEGAFDTASKRASFSVDMSSFASLLGGLFAGMGNQSSGIDFTDPSGWKIDAVQDGAVSYVHFPALQSQLPAGKSWIRADGSPGASQGLDFSEFEQLTKNDPREMLELLQGASGEIETMGAEELRGVATTHYRATIDPLEMAGAAATGNQELGSLAQQLTAQSGIGAVPVDIWLDADGLVRKLTLAFSATQPGTSDASEVAVTFELYDYGEQVTIDLPPASEVVDASAVRS